MDVSDTPPWVCTEALMLGLVQPHGQLRKIGVYVTGKGSKPERLLQLLLCLQLGLELHRKMDQ